MLLPKTDRTVCAWSFNLRRDKFVILGGRREVFYALTRCYFNWGTEGKVSPRGARCQVNHRGVNVFCLLILHVTTTRHDKLTSEIYCGTQLLPKKLFLTCLYVERAIKRLQIHGFTWLSKGRTYRFGLNAFQLRHLRSRPTDRVSNFGLRAVIHLKVPK